MSLVVVIEGLFLLVLLACSAFFSSAETALFSLNPIHLHRVRRVRPAVADRLERMLARPSRLLSTILVGNTLVNVAAAGLGYILAERLLAAYAETVAIVVMTFALLIFGEVAPKRLAMSRPVRIAELYAPVLILLGRVLTPVRLVLERIADLFSGQLVQEQKSLTEEEFRTVVEVGEEEGVLDEEERTMVDGIIRLEETQASEIMTPRVDLVGIDLDDPAEEQERVARSVQFRYLPVYRDSLDQAEGFLDVPRFLLGTGDLKSATIPPFFVPETVPLDTLLATFQRERKRVAFVADEFGGTAGLVTRGDILEEIAEDVDNEYGDEKLTIQQVGTRRWLVDGSTSIEDVNYELDLELEADGADRIGGWLSAQVERIPRAGDVVEAQGCRATAQRVRKRRVSLALLEKPEEAPPPPGEEDEA